MMHLFGRSQLDLQEGSLVGVLCQIFALASRAEVDLLEVFQVDLPLRKNYGGSLLVLQTDAISK